MKYAAAHIFGALIALAGYSAAAKLPPFEQWTYAVQEGKTDWCVRGKGRCEAVLFHCELGR